MSFGQSPNGLASKEQNDEEDKEAPKVKAKVAVTTNQPAGSLEEVF